MRPTSMTGPASVTVTPGSNATFSVTGYPGIGPSITYQWQRSSDGTTWSNVPGAQTSTLTIPSVTPSDSGMQVRVLAADGYGNDDTSATATLTVSSTPTPTPGDTPSAPREPRATAGPSSATITWAAPSSSGSFPVSTYQVRNDRDAVTCLLTVTAGTPLECTLAGLTRGLPYRFSVRALNGAGWGPWSGWTNAVTPTPPAPPITITIVGFRQGRHAVVNGSTTGLAGGQVQAMVKVTGQRNYVAGAIRPVDDEGDFTWRRSTPKRVSIYFTSGRVASNRVTIPARAPSAG